MTHKHIRLIVFYTLFTLLMALPSGMACAADKIYVIDGDTFSWNGRTYRLWGIDAPEQKQSCRRGTKRKRVLWPCAGSVVKIWRG